MSESPQGPVSFGLPLPALRFYFPAVYLGGERPGRPGRGSQNKVLIVAAACLNDAGNPLYVKVTPVAAFSNAAISSWARAHPQPGCAVLSDGLGNLKTMLSRAYKVYRFNRCLDLAGLVTRLLVDVCRGTAATLRVIRHAETRFESGGLMCCIACVTVSAVCDDRLL